MTPGLPELVEYQEAAERLHEHPFITATELVLQAGRLTKGVTLTVYIKHVPHRFLGLTYEEAHHKAVRTLVVYGRLDRIRGDAWEKTAWR